MDILVRTLTLEMSSSGGQMGDLGKGEEQRIKIVKQLHG